MRVKEVYDILKNTELKQIVVGEDENQVLSLLNLAFIEVYGKFNILQEEQLITVVPGKTRYRLQDNSQAVLQVFMRNKKKDPLLGDDGFKEVPINDINNAESVFTPQPYVLHIPNPEDGRVYSVVQTVTPPYITKDNINTIDFIVPPQYLDVILSYAAYRAYKSMNGDEQSEIGSHYRAYMGACKEIYRKGLVNHSILTNEKALDRGFPANSQSEYEG
jgi:hypothetical protein